MGSGPWMFNPIHEARDSNGPYGWCYDVWLGDKTVVRVTRVGYPDQKRADDDGHEFWGRLPHDSPERIVTFPMGTKAQGLPDLTALPFALEEVKDDFFECPYEACVLRVYQVFEPTCCTDFLWVWGVRRELGDGTVLDVTCAGYETKDLAVCGLATFITDKGHLKLAEVALAMSNDTKEGCTT